MSTPFATKSKSIVMLVKSQALSPKPCETNKAVQSRPAPKRSLILLNQQPLSSYRTITLYRSVSHSWPPTRHVLSSRVYTEHLSRISWA